jgi:hypothetical protein
VLLPGSHTERRKTSAYLTISKPFRAIFQSRTLVVDSGASAFGHKLLQGSRQVLRTPYFTDQPKTISPLQSPFPGSPTCAPSRPLVLPRPIGLGFLPLVEPFPALSRVVPPSFCLSRFHLLPPLAPRALPRFFAITKALSPPGYSSSDLLPAMNSVPPFLASAQKGGLTNASWPNRVRHCFVYGLRSLPAALHLSSPSRSCLQLRTDQCFRPIGTFHPTVGAYSQAHLSCPFGAGVSGRMTGAKHPPGATGGYQRGSRNPRPPEPLAFCLRYSA